MSELKFPTNSSPGDTVAAVNKTWQYDGSKWELHPLKDEFTSQLPVVVEEDSIDGVGRTFDHSFTIKDLQDLEYERFNNAQNELPDLPVLPEV